MEYTVNYFIRKFEAIPEEMWCVGAYTYGDRHCAYGHCGIDKSFDEADALFWMFTSNLNAQSSPISVNDGKCPAYKQPTPKQRILAALYDIKKLQDGDVGKAEPTQKEKVIHHYVSVPTSISEQVEELIMS